MDALSENRMATTPKINRPLLHLLRILILKPPALLVLLQAALAVRGEVGEGQVAEAAAVVRAGAAWWGRREH